VLNHELGLAEWHKKLVCVIFAFDLPACLTAEPKFKLFGSI
jgi:hypothetical protein